MKSCSQRTSSVTHSNMRSSLKFKVQSSKSRHQPSTLNLEPATSSYLLDGCENGGRVVGDAEGDAGARAELGQALDAGGVEAQPSGLDLKPEAELAQRLGAQRRGAAARVGAAVDLGGDVDRLVDAEDAAQPVEQHVVLREEPRRRGVDADAEVAESVQTAVAPKLLADEDDAEGVGLVDADAARLVRVRQLDAELKAQRGPAPRLVAQLDLGRQTKVARVVGRVGSGRDLKRNRARGARVDAEEVLRHALDRELDVGREPDVDADDADARQIARQPGRRELRILHKVDSDLYAQRAGLEHIHVFGQERPLLRVRRRRERERERQRE